MKRYICTKYVSLLCIMLFGEIALFPAGQKMTQQNFENAVQLISFKLPQVLLNLIHQYVGQYEYKERIRHSLPRSACNLPVQAMIRVEDNFYMISRQSILRDRFVKVASWGCASVDLGEQRSSLCALPDYIAIGTYTKGIMMYEYAHENLRFIGFLGPQHLFPIRCMTMMKDPRLVYATWSNMSKRMEIRTVLLNLFREVEIVYEFAKQAEEEPVSCLGLITLDDSRVISWNRHSLSILGTRQKRWRELVKYPVPDGYSFISGSGICLDLEHAVIPALHEQSKKKGLCLINVESGKAVETNFMGIASNHIVRDEETRDISLINQHREIISYQPLQSYKLIEGE